MNHILSFSSINNNSAQKRTFKTLDVRIALFSLSLTDPVEFTGDPHRDQLHKLKRRETVTLKNYTSIVFQIKLPNEGITSFRLILNTHKSVHKHVDKIQTLYHTDDHNTTHTKSNLIPTPLFHRNK